MLLSPKNFLIDPLKNYRLLYCSSGLGSVTVPRKIALSLKKMDLPQKTEEFHRMKLAVKASHTTMTAAKPQAWGQLKNLSHETTNMVQGKGTMVCLQRHCF